MGCGHSAPSFSQPLLLNNDEPSCNSSARNFDLSESNAKTPSADPRLIDAAWKVANDQAARTKPLKAPVVKRSTWQTVRIFVSSTFKDFDSEREILVKKVFPDLKAWCEARQLHLIECDLRWGVPLDSAKEVSLRTCLGELDRCFSENAAAFFISMVGERIGWVPAIDHVPESVKQQYQWIDGMSVTEMEIIYGAYRWKNPNALFLIRDRSFLDEVPEEYAKYYLDESPIACYKLKKLKEMLVKRFGKVIANYKCGYLGVDPVTKWPRLCNLDEFSQAVFQFFANRISLQYPLIEGAKLRPLEEVRAQHTSFMKLQAELAVGIDNLVCELIKQHINDPPCSQPVLITGGPGLGKSMVMCLLANACIGNSSSPKLIRPKKTKRWTVFYHFTGAVAGSIILLDMLNRMLLELKVLPNHASLPTDLEEAMGLVRGVLSKESTPDCIVIVDAINQFADVRGNLAPVAWLPAKLGKNVRVFVSAATGSSQCQNVERAFADQWSIVLLQPLDRQTKEKLVSSQLLRYNKILDGPQMELLLNKSSSDNPLWLTLAAEELRVFGHVRQLTSKVISLPDGLQDLEEEILARFERETEAALFVATLCLLECSSNGLLEPELVRLLASPDIVPQQLLRLLNSKYHVDIATAKDPANENRDDGRAQGRVAANRWANIYRVLRPFLRPFGPSGEGRLDFYHRSLSKCVRKRYFEGDQGNHTRRHFCRILADYFNNEDLANLDRRISEYPMAAFKCGDLCGLKAFLSDFTVFDAMYDAEFSWQLSDGWAMVHKLEQKNDSDDDNTCASMQATYMRIAEEIYSNEQKSYFFRRWSQRRPTSRNNKEKQSLLTRLDRIARILMQNRCCEAAGEIANRLLMMTDIEQNEHTKSIEKLLLRADYIYLKTIIMDEDLRVHDYYLRTHLSGYDPTEIVPRLLELVDCYQTAIAIFQKHSPEDIRLARCLNGVAFHYSGISIRGGDSTLSENSAKKMAIRHIEEAIKLYLSQSDNTLSIADCFVTRGVCEGDPTAQQLEFFEKAQKLIMEKFGPFHPLLLRVYFNTGIYYQEIGNGDEAFQWFKKWHQLLEDVFGGHHPRTNQARQFVAEANFRKLAEKNRRRSAEEAKQLLRNNGFL